MATQRTTPGEFGDRPGSGIADSVKQAAGSTAESARQAAGQVAEKVKEETRSRAEKGKHGTASGLASVAQAVRRMGENLRSEEPHFVAQRAAQYGDTLAARMEHASEYLDNHDLNQVLGEVERFARRRPALFFGAAFAVGFALTRFLKSSRVEQGSHWTGVEEHSEAHGPGSFRPAERWSEPGRATETWSESRPYSPPYTPDYSSEP